MSDFYSVPKSLFRENWLSFDSPQQLNILHTPKIMSECSKAISQSFNLIHAQSKNSIFCILHCWQGPLKSIFSLLSFPILCEVLGNSTWIWNQDKAIPLYCLKSSAYFSLWAEVKTRPFILLNIRKLLWTFLHLLQSTFLTLGTAEEFEIPLSKLRIPPRGKSWKLGLGSLIQYYIRLPVSQTFN